jgi:hypothetical protein
MSAGQSIKGTKSDSGAAKRKRKKADELLTTSLTGSISIENDIAQDFSALLKTFAKLRVQKHEKLLSANY